MGRVHRGRWADGHGRVDVRMGSPALRLAGQPGAMARLLRRSAVLGLLSPGSADHPTATIHIVSGDVRPVYEEMITALPDKNIWIVGGGDLAGQFNDANLLDEVWLGM